MQYSGLGEVRTELAHLSLGTAAREAGLSPERLLAIETGDAPSVLGFERLAGVYGVDADVLWDEPVRIERQDGVVLLTSLDEFKALSDVTRARILRAANAARDLRSLRDLLGEASDRWCPLRPAVHMLSYQQGAALAQQVRHEFGLVYPIASVRDLVLMRFPWIGLLYSKLGNVGAPAGLSFADHRRGPAIVLNLDGKNSNAAVRRFSLAHELAHLLVDWSQGQPLACISGFLSETALDREQRANGFAARLLCPSPSSSGSAACVTKMRCACCSRTTGCTTPPPGSIFTTRPTSRCHQKRQGKSLPLRDRLRAGWKRKRLEASTIFQCLPLLASGEGSSLASRAAHTPRTCSLAMRSRAFSV